MGKIITTSSFDFVQQTAYDADPIASYIADIIISQPRMEITMKYDQFSDAIYVTSGEKNLLFHYNNGYCFVCYCLRKAVVDELTKRLADKKVKEIDKNVMRTVLELKGNTE